RHLLPLALLFYFTSSTDHLYTHSFPTRRSSDLRLLSTTYNSIMMTFTCNPKPKNVQNQKRVISDLISLIGIEKTFIAHFSFFFLDRKSTRLNSSHVKTSYAVFCLKKKK